MKYGLPKSGGRIVREYFMERLPSNSPTVESTSGVSGWFQVWIKAVTRPNEQAFIEIASSPAASSKTAFIWVFIAGALSGLVSGLIVKALVDAGSFKDLEKFSDGAKIGIGLESVLCGVPVYGLLSVAGLAVSVSAMQWIAGLFCGKGTFEKLAYAVAAITVPASLVAMFFVPLSIVPRFGIYAVLFSFGIGLYALFLQITAVKAVNGFGWGAAIGSVLILPGALIFCSCIFIGALTLSGPAVSNVFRTINQ